MKVSSVMFQHVVDDILSKMKMAHAYYSYLQKKAKKEEFIIEKNL